MTGSPITKTQRLIGLMHAGDWPRALSLANTFRRLGPYRDTIRLAHECRAFPRFYRALGRDPEATVAAGIDALKRLYPGQSEGQMAPASAPVPSSCHGDPNDIRPDS